MRSIGVLIFLCFSTFLNIHSQMINDDYQMKGYLNYFGDTIVCKPKNAYSIAHNNAVNSDFLWYSNSQGLESFFFCANNLSENIREKSLELVFGYSGTDKWKNEELDSAYNYFKKTYPQNIKLLKIEERVKKLKSLNIGQKIPDLSFRTIDNTNELQLNDFKNKPVLLKLIGLDSGCHHDSNSVIMSGFLKDIDEENNTPTFNGVHVLTIFMTNHKDEWLSAIGDPKKYQTSVFFANDPDSVYKRFGCMGGAVFLIDGNGIIASNRHFSITAKHGGLYSFEYFTHLLKLNNGIYKPTDSPYDFAEHLLKRSITSTLTSDIFVPYDTLKVLDQKGYLRMHKIKIRKDYDSDYMKRFIEEAKELNKFKKDKVVIQKINFETQSNDNIVDCIQIVFKVNNKDLYELLIPNCINYNNKWYIFSGFPLCTKFSYKGPGITSPRQ